MYGILEYPNHIVYEANIVFTSIDECSQSYI